MNEDLGGIFKPEAKTIKKVFGDIDSYYHIPDYQRPYSWEDEQIVQLWEDVLSAMEGGDANYFLGPIILIRTKDGYEVVDGQQRLTTLTILFCTLRDGYFKDDKNIENFIKSLTDGKYRLRLITQPHDRNKLEQDILEGINFPQKQLSIKEKSENKFLNAALIFRERLQDLDSDQRRKELIDYILDKTIMIAITCSDKSYAIKLFQILNARGLDLSPSDLIKSDLYRKCEDSKKEQFIANWKQIEDLSGQIEETLTNLLTYYEYYLLGENPKKSLNEELEYQFKKKESNAIIWEFKKVAESYRNIYQEESSLMFSFYYLPNQVFWKSILTTAKYKEYSNFIELCKEMRRMFYSYWIAGYTSSKVKQLSFNIISWLKEKKEIYFIKEEVQKKLIEHKVTERMNTNLTGEVYGETWLKPLLILIEYMQTDGSKISFIELDNKLHVDHILPQEWNSVKEWRELWNEQQAQKWLNRFGNLTLLSGKKNIAQSNDPPSKKKEMYEIGHGGKTAFEISKRLIGSFEHEGWTERDAEEREEWILGQVKQVFES